MNNLEDFFNRYKAMLHNVHFIYNNTELTHLDWERNGIYYSVTAPHEGNNFMYMLRANPVATFDKWSNADYEEFYDDLYELARDIDYETGIILELLSVYVDRYLED